jgi:DNA-binding MltR family transcriptional regulator
MSDRDVFLQKNFERVKRFRESLTPETDRGCAITAAAFVDEELKQLLSAALVDERELVDEAFKRNGPLATFSARADFAFLLGLLSRDAWRDLHLLRRIRNDFAHSPDPLSFTTESIQSRCGELTYSAREREATARQHFTAAVCGLLSSIHASLFRAERPAVPKGLTSEEMAKARADVQDFRQRLRKRLEELGDEPNPQAAKDIADELIRTLTQEPTQCQQPNSTQATS